MVYATGAGGAPESAADPLILDLLEWLAPGPRPYAEAMEVWRSSCPRLTVWEDALDAAVIRRRREAADPCAMVAITELGRRTLAVHGRG